MTTRDKHIAQKKKEIEKIAKRQAGLMKQIQKLAAMPYKRPATFMRRAAKLLSLHRQIGNLEIEKQIIIARPIPKRELGGIIAGNMAVFAESSPEYITAGNLRIYPNPLVKKGESLVVISESRPIDVNALKNLDLEPKRWLHSTGKEIQIKLP